MRFPCQLKRRGLIFPEECGREKTCPILFGFKEHFPMEPPCCFFLRRKPPVGPAWEKGPEELIN
jgi:hypothetical protein